MKKSIIGVEIAIGLLLGCTISVGAAETTEEEKYVSKETVYGSDGSVSFYYQYMYDDNWKLTQKDTVNAGDGSISGSVKYTYDENNNVLLEEHVDYRMDELSYNLQNEYENNNLIKSTAYDNSENVKFSYEYIYEGDRLIQEDFVNVEYDFESSQYYFYDQDNRVIYTEKEEEGERKREYEYVYDSENNLISKLDSNHNGYEWKYENGYKIEEKYFYEGDLSYRSEYEYTSASPEAIIVEDSEIIKLVQSTLNEKGFSCGTPDGIAGAGTQAAVKSFMESCGKASEGQITEEVVLLLEIEEQMQEIKKWAEYRTDVTYEMLMRNPTDYINTKVKFSGTVEQVISDGGKFMRLAVDSDSNQVIWCSYSGIDMEGNLLEGDQVTIYGTAMGNKEYIAVLGNEISLPDILCDRIETAFGTFEKFPGFR